MNALLVYDYKVQLCNLRGALKSVNKKVSHGSLMGLINVLPLLISNGIKKAHHKRVKPRKTKKFPAILY